MKHLFLSMFAVCVLFACKGTKTAQASTNPEKIKAKVVRLSCATTVIQILDKKYANLGETWTVFDTNQTIENAVNVLNKCEVPSDLKVGDEFYFTLATKETTRQDCIMCMMMDYPPTKNIYLKLVREK